MQLNGRLAKERRAARTGDVVQASRPAVRADDPSRPLASRTCAGGRVHRLAAAARLARNGALALAATCGWAAGAEAGAQESLPPMSLDEAIERALVHNPQIAQSQAALSNASGTRRRAVGSFLPNVSMGSGASVQSQSRFDPNTQRVVAGSSDSYNASINASYQLFQGGRKFHELSRTGSALRQAQANLRDQRFAVLLQTRTLFMNALRQAELVDVARARVQRAEESLDMTRTQVQVGTGTRSDSLRTRLELANARQSLLQVENQLRAARFSLGRQVGVSGPVEPVLPDNLDPAPLALEDAEIFMLAESVSPAVLAAEAAAAVANAALGNAKSSYLPSLSLSSGYTWANQTPALSGGNTSWSFRLSGNYQLFDGFQRSANVSQASESRRVARLSEEDARRAVRQGVDAALRTLETQEQAIEIAREAVGVAEEDLRFIRERYAVQMASALDVITSQVALDQAEADLVSVRYDYMLAKAELESIVGRSL